MHTISHQCSISLAARVRIAGVATRFGTPLTSRIVDSHAAGTMGQFHAVALGMRLAACPHIAGVAAATTTSATLVQGKPCQDTRGPGSGCFPSRCAATCTPVPQTRKNKPCGACPSSAEGCSRQSLHLAVVTRTKITQADGTKPIVRLQP